MYLNFPFNHFSAIQQWVSGSGASATLDLQDFTIEVKHRNRYFRLYPLFQAYVNGLMVHLPTLTPDARGFGGWRPYQTLTHTHSSDKQLFKDFLRASGLRTPMAWAEYSEPPACDYVLKARKGSFGRGLFGPFRGGTAAHLQDTETAPHGALFAEQFVHGRILKVWYWGARPFFAHMESYPTIVGDGNTTAEALLHRKLRAAVGRNPSLLPFAAECLAFQGIGMSDVLAEGQEAWIDYRYQQQYATSGSPTPVSDNRLQALADASGSQLEAMGKALADLLRQTIPVPVMITVDGILDEEGRIWWLEMNTNSLLPPEGYATMFADLFA